MIWASILGFGEEQFAEQVYTYEYVLIQGPDWQWGDQNGSDDSIGTVYRVQKSGVVYVRFCENYSYVQGCKHHCICNMFVFAICRCDGPTVIKVITDLVTKTNMT